MRPILRQRASEFADRDCCWKWVRGSWFSPAIQSVCVSKWYGGNGCATRTHPGTLEFWRNQAESARSVRKKPHDRENPLSRRSRWTVAPAVWKDSLRLLKTDFTTQARV